jgi:hypothetical protein
MGRFLVYCSSPANIYGCALPARFHTKSVLGCSRLNDCLQHPQTSITPAAYVSNDIGLSDSPVSLFDILEIVDF